MPDEPSGYELQRSIEAMRSDMRDGIAAINSRLDKLVSVEAHAADLRRVDERMADLAKDIADEQQRRQEAVQRLETQMQRMVTTQRYVAAAILLPVALFIGNLLLARSGG